MDGCRGSYIDDFDCIGDCISEDSDDGLSLLLINSGKLYLLEGSASSLDWSDGISEGWGVGLSQ